MYSIVIYYVTIFLYYVITMVYIFFYYVTVKGSVMLEFLVGSLTMNYIFLHSNLLVTPDKVQLWSYYYGV